MHLYRRRTSAVVSRLVNRDGEGGALGPLVGLDDVGAAGGAGHGGGGWYWVTDERDAYFAARVVKGDPAGGAGATLHVLRYGSPVGRAAEAVDAARLGPAIPWLGALREHADDLVQMDEVHEASILHCLKARFEQDHIYTNVGDILVSINPFKWLPVYGADVVEHYRAFDERSKPAPHVFIVAAEAFQGMLTQRRDQSILISGESGAGKTEATKQVHLNDCLIADARASGR
jgi:myosin heavy subunit